MNSLAEMIQKCIDVAGEEAKTREAALVLTKLQEAKLWLGEHHKVLANKVKEHTRGMKSGPTPT